MRDFIESDLERIDLNEFSCDALKYRDVFLSDVFKKYTLDVNGKVWCIIAFREHKPQNYWAFMMFDKNIPFIYARKIRAFMNKQALHLIKLKCLRHQKIAYLFECLKLWLNYLDNYILLIVPQHIY